VEIIYANIKTGYEEGRSYSNPRFFNGQIRPKVHRAIVIGDWPLVVDAYQKAGIPVIQLPEGSRASDGEGVKPLEAPEPEKAPGSDVVIPSEEEFNALDWTDMRALVKSLGGSVTNKTAAKDFVDEKRAEREAADAAADQDNQ
jgi:hypothetical protein